MRNGISPSLSRRPSAWAEFSKRVRPLVSSTRPRPAGKTLQSRQAIVPTGLPAISPKAIVAARRLQQEARPRARREPLGFMIRTSVPDREDFDMAPWTNGRPSPRRWTPLLLIALAGAVLA